MPPSVRAKRNPARTRRKLQDAAIRLFSTYGYHGVSVDQIVAAARVNKRMVYHYFGSKEAIFQAALHDVYDRLQGVEFHAVERGSGPREKLTRLLESYFTFLDENPEFTQLLLWENAEKGRHIAKASNRLTKNPFLEGFRKIVEDGVAAGEFRPDINVAHLLIHFIGLCFIYHSNRFSLSQGLNIDLGDPAEKARGLDSVLHLVFEGITEPAARAAAKAAGQVDGAGSGGRSGGRRVSQPQARS